MKRRHVLATASLAGLALALLTPASVVGQAPSAPISANQHYDEALLSKPTYEARVEIDVRIPLRDGVTTSVDIYRPDAEGRFPAILVRSPYNNNIERNILQSTFFAERGYVYLYEDVRGKFDSHGEFYRETRGQRPGSLIEPGKVYEHTIDLWSASNLFKAGHRIRLEVSSSNFPHFDRNLNTGEDTATGSRIEKATQTIYHSAKYPSHLVLPVVPR